ncbi:MAG: protein-glutamate O-methyltransferase CheR [Tepidisphaeraceae bacterium]
MTETTDFMLTQAEFELVRGVVYEHCGISLNDDKVALVRARLSKQVRAGGFSSVKQYLDDALKDRKSVAFTKLINSISTNLTSFFRESQHFDYLTKTFLPAMAERKRKTGTKTVLGWSAACSSGEEPYTLAMSLLDADAKSGQSGKLDYRLLATDISTAVLDIAQTGVYPAGRMNGVPDKFRNEYFNSIMPDASGQPQYRVTPEIAKMIRFRHLNLMESWPFNGPFDFIFCRNVMIYFDRKTQERLVDRFYNCLAPGGLLFTGHSESLTGMVHRFAHRRPSIYEKVGD